MANNGADNGIITFNVPAANAQDFHTNMATGVTVNFAVSGVAYSDIHAVSEL